MLHVSCLALGFMGGHEWILILLVVVLFFGKRIPGVARSLGSGINEFKSGLREGAENAKTSEQDSASQVEQGSTGDPASPASKASKVESGS